MTSKIKVDNINKVSDDSNIIKKCGTTTTIGSGASNPIVVDGSTVTLGRCGGTVSLASGATQSGFGRTGTVDWQTSSIKTATFTAVNGEGYFCNTAGGSFTVNLPAGSAGAIVSLQDYNNTFDSNSLSISPNGSEKINGGAAGGLIQLSTEGEGLTLVYVDGTVGWRSIQDSDFAATGSVSLIASGGTITTCGNFKIHTFTGPGTFCVSQISGTAAENTVGYMVIAGGGAGGNSAGPGYTGGGGAGGYREGRSDRIDNFTASPLVANAPTNAVTVTVQGYPITVGGGGGPASGGSGNGSNSIFSTITSTGGGEGRYGNCAPKVGSGGSGGGGDGGGPGPAGTGNTPPVSPPQGTPGGSSGGTNAPRHGRGGGGGATDPGSQGSPSSGGEGGAGATSSITGSPVTRAGGGGGGYYTHDGCSPGARGAGGPGGGGNGATTRSSGGGNGTANEGGGGGGDSAGGSPPGSGTAGNGGSGVVIIRYKFQ